MKISKILFYIILFISTTSYSQKKENFVQIIVQPEIELNKSFYINVVYEVKPDSIWTVDKIENLTLSDSFNTAINIINESNSRDNEGNILKTKYNSTQIAIPEKIGKIDFPIIYYKIKEKTFQTKPFSVQVVEKLKIESDAIILELSANKKEAKLNDTIVVQLTEYSKFGKNYRFLKKKKNYDELQLSGKENTVSVSYSKTLEEIIGIENFEDIFANQLNLTSFNWNPFNDNREIKNINGINYIQTNVFTFSFTPKSKGNITIGPCEYEYLIEKSITKDFNDPDDNKKFDFKSNIIELKIK